MKKIYKKWAKIAIAKLIVKIHYYQPCYLFVSSMGSMALWLTSLEWSFHHWNPPNITLWCGGNMAGFCQILGPLEWHVEDMSVTMSPEVHWLCVAWFISILGHMALIDKPGMELPSLVIGTLPTSHFGVVATWLVFATFWGLLSGMWRIWVWQWVQRYIDCVWHSFISILGTMALIDEPGMGIQSLGPSQPHTLV